VTTAAPVQVDLHRVRMPLRHPHRAAHGSEDLRSSILVRVELTGGSIGWGECPALAAPGYTAEHHEGAWAQLRDDIVPWLLGVGPKAVGAPSMVTHPMAGGSIRDACLDAELRQQGRSLATHFAIRRRLVPTTTVISFADSIDALLAAVDDSPGAVKLKIEPGRALEPLRAVRDTFPGRPLAADANGSFDPGSSDDLATLAAIDALELTYLEQPHADIDANGQLAKALHTPICLDESITTVPAAEAALAAGAMAVLNVKAARLGGVRHAMLFVRWAAERGVDTFIGGMLETGVGRASGATLAMLPGCTLPSDLGPSSRYWDQDVTAPITVDGDGQLVPPPSHAAGIGVVPDPDRLAAVTVEHLTFTR